MPADKHTKRILWMNKKQLNPRLIEIVMTQNDLRALRMLRTAVTPSRDYIFRDPSSFQFFRWLWYNYPNIFNDDNVDSLAAYPEIFEWIIRRRPFTDDNHHYRNMSLLRSGNFRHLQKHIIQPLVMINFHSLIKSRNPRFIQRVIKTYSNQFNRASYADHANMIRYAIQCNLPSIVSYVLKKNPAIAPNVSNELFRSGNIKLTKQIHKRHPQLIGQLSSLPLFCESNPEYIHWYQKHIGPCIKHVFTGYNGNSLRMNRLLLRYVPITYTSDKIARLHFGDAIPQCLYFY